MPWNLLLAVPWLLLAVALLTWHALHPDDPRFRVFGGGVSWGWPALLLGLYNLARWWSSRKKAPRPDETRRPRRDEAPPTVHPEFDFSRPPDETNS